jgi:hypothetical protein
MTTSQREFRHAANRGRTGFNERLRRRQRRLTATERHARKCVICNHPRREEIEAAFLSWLSPRVIVSEFRLDFPRYLYRHAHATGLYQLRRFKLSCAAERVVEHVGSVRPNANAVLRAIRVSCSIDDHGNWREPARAAAPGSTKARDAGDSPKATAPNSTTLATEIEPGVSLITSVRGVRLSSNRHFLARLKTSPNA